VVAQALTGATTVANAKGSTNADRISMLFALQWCISMHLCRRCDTPLSGHLLFLQSPYRPNQK
jgi:hypothetical protein